MSPSQCRNTRGLPSDLPLRLERESFADLEKRTLDAVMERLLDKWDDRGFHAAIEESLLHYRFVAWLSRWIEAVLANAWLTVAAASLEVEVAWRMQKMPNMLAEVSIRLRRPLIDKNGVVLAAGPYLPSLTFILRPDATVWIGTFDPAPDLAPFQVHVPAHVILLDNLAVKDVAAAFIMYFESVLAGLGKPPVPRDPGPV